MPRLQHQCEQVFRNATAAHEQLFQQGVRGMLVAEANTMNAVQAGRRSYRVAAMKQQSQVSKMQSDSRSVLVRVL